MIGKLDEALSFNSIALRLRAERQQLLSANIANADTPNYKAADFDFGRALEGAMRTSSTTLAARPAATAPGHIGTLSGSTGNVQIQFRAPTQGSIDGNSVEMDTERAQFADNAVRYEASLRFLNGQFKTILSAIQG